MDPSNGRSQNPDRRSRTPSRAEARTDVAAAAPATPIARWVQVCGAAAILAALPTVIWRSLIGFGFTLGTPDSWRNAEQIPGVGTSYVLTLSAVQLLAALLALVLIVPNADRVPRWSPVLPGRRAPTSLVVGVGLLGASLVAALCVLSIVNWAQVNPFRDAGTVSGWSYLCWGCYVVAPAWPVLLTATILGYGRGRRISRLAPKGR